MNVAGFQTNSFIDYPAKIASVVFLGGCNFRCYYCHNFSLLAHTSNSMPFDDVLARLREQIGFIDAVVFSGGEPATHPNLVDMIRAVKSMGLLVKLDTNGTDANLLEGLVRDGLVDYVAMDVKAPLHKYNDIVECNADGVKESIDFLIRQKKVDYMFRTTLAPTLTEDDLHEMAKLISGAKTFQLQQFVPNDFSNSHKIVHLPYSSKDADRFAEIFKPYVREVILRGF